MKSQERHKLQQNALADWLAKVITATRPYHNAILTGLIVVILVFIVAAWWNSESAAQAENAWTQFFTAFGNSSTSQLVKVAEDYPRSKASPAAVLAAADLQLAQGCNLLFINKASANQELNKAVEMYQSVLDQTRSAVFRAQATFGLARTREAQGKLESAVELYSELTTQWPDTAFAQLAARRLEDLKRAATKELYDKFAQFDPKPAFSKEPAEKSGLDKLPEESPIFKLGTSSDQKPEEKAEDKPANKTEESKPGENPEKPAVSQPSPSGEKPVDAQPAPVTDKPASEKTTSETSSASESTSKVPPKN